MGVGVKELSRENEILAVITDVSLSLVLGLYKAVYKYCWYCAKIWGLQAPCYYVIHLKRKLGTIIPIHFGEEYFM